jgi:hypothetical protein
MNDYNFKNNNYIVWKLNRETDEWELPNFDRNPDEHFWGSCEPKDNIWIDKFLTLKESILFDRFH